MFEVYTRFWWWIKAQSLRKDWILYGDSLIVWNNSSFTKWRCFYGCISYWSYQSPIWVGLTPLNYLRVLGWFNCCCNHLYKTIWWNWRIFWPSSFLIWFLQIKWETLKPENSMIFKGWSNLWYRASLKLSKNSIWWFNLYWGI